MAKTERPGRYACAMRVAVIGVPTGTVVSRASTKPPLNANLLTQP